jgi:hypothetical protein
MWVYFTYFPKSKNKTGVTSSAKFWWLLGGPVVRLCCGVLSESDREGVCLHRCCSESDREGVCLNCCFWVPVVVGYVARLRLELGVWESVSESCVGVLTQILYRGEGCGVIVCVCKVQRVCIGPGNVEVCRWEHVNGWANLRPWWCHVGLVVVGKLERGAMILLVRGGANVEGDGGDEGQFCWIKKVGWGQRTVVEGARKEHRELGGQGVEWVI